MTDHTDHAADPTPTGAPLLVATRWEHTECGHVQTFDPHPDPRSPGSGPSAGVRCEGCGHPTGLEEWDPMSIAGPAQLDLAAIEVRAAVARPSRLRTAMGCIPDGEIRQGCIVSDGTIIRAAVRAAAQLVFKDVPALVARVRQLETELDTARRHLAAALPSAIADDTPADLAEQLVAELEAVRRLGLQVINAHSRAIRELEAERDTARRDGAADGILLARDHVSYDDRDVLTLLAQHVRDGLTIPTTDTTEETL